MRRAAAATAAVVLLLAGCQDGDDPSGTPTGTVPTSADATTTPPTEPEETSVPATDGATDGATGETSEASTDGATTDGATTDEATDDPGTAGSPQALPAWTDDAQERSPGQAAAGGSQEITDVRTGLHEDFDRVVLDLTGDDPVLGWFVGPVDEAVDDPSGLPLDVEGEDFLQLSVRGIDWTSDSPDRYGGAPVAGQGTLVLTEVVFGGLFEGQQQVVLGLRDETDYRIFTLSDPARIVVDLRHP